MSNIAISGASTGTATFTIESPATSTNRTITLADATGTMVVSGTTPLLNGITFPATQVASADANTLDDYEEGTWTPNVGGNATYSTQTGVYVKIGRTVFVTFDIEINAIGTGSTTTISGLPFTTSNLGVGACGYFVNLLNNVYSLNCNTNGTNILFNAMTSLSGGVTQNIAVFKNATRIQANITYFV
jgi:hypothetical protein